MESFDNIPKNASGIVVNGIFHPVDCLPQLISVFTASIMEKITPLLPSVEEDEDKIYTVNEVAHITRKSQPTITRHIRLGLLKGSKVGKSWLITQQDFNRYRFNKYEE